MVDFCISVNWVPLDEYYYSKKEGDPVYREEKGEYRFKVCNICLIFTILIILTTNWSIN